MDEQKKTKFFNLCKRTNKLNLREKEEMCSSNMKYILY